MRLFIYLLVGLFAAATTARNLTAIECPFPEGQSVVSEQTCAKYTACQWTGEVCHMRDNREAGYYVASKHYNTDGGFKVDLKKGNDSVTMFKEDVSELVFEVIFHEMDHLEIKIYDKNSQRYEVPLPLNLPQTPTKFPKYEVNLSEMGHPLQFNITRKSNGVNVFRSIGPLTYENQFIQFHTCLPSKYLYGLGENVHNSLRHVFEPRQTYPIFAKANVYAQGHTNQYGYHPYYINLENQEGNTHSFLLHNSNAMEYSTFLLDDGNPALTLRTIGGIIDFHIFFGDSPVGVYQHYARATGFSQMPPYWALGFHLSRWGYKSTDAVRDLRKRMKENIIPQDVQYFDIDYMDQYRDFTYQESWKDLPELVKELNEENVHTVMVMDPVIATDFDKYGPATRGKSADVFMKWQNPAYVPPDQPKDAADYVVGTTWNRTIVFPDFLKESAVEWWGDELQKFQKTVSFDGVWLDENEPMNYNTVTEKDITTTKIRIMERESYITEVEEESDSEVLLKLMEIFDLEDVSSIVESASYAKKDYVMSDSVLSLKCPSNSSLNNPPYPTMMIRVGKNATGSISDGTTCMSTNQTMGNVTFQHYDVHSLYGISQAIATHRGLKAMSPEKRPFILSRSTFPGSGSVSAHWTGDNKAEWDQMRLSIISIFEFGMFNIPLTGADICGFLGTPDMELCARWMQLGSFYPFSRNHNSINSPDQDPTVWPEVAKISRNVLGIRYLLLPYLYTLFYIAHVYGSPVVHPMFLEFYWDLYARDVEDQFLWGSSLMIAPVLEKGAVNRTVYFPEGDWYTPTGQNYSGPMNATVPAPLETIPLFYRAGFIIPVQKAAENTVESREEAFGLYVIPRGANNSTHGRFAQGFLYYDSGDGAVNGTSVGYRFSQDTLTSHPDKAAALLQGKKMGFMNFFAMTSSPSTVVLDGTELPPEQWRYLKDQQMLEIIVLIDMSASFKIVLKYD